MQSSQLPLPSAPHIRHANKNKTNTPHSIIHIHTFKITTRAFLPAYLHGPDREAVVHLRQLLQLEVVRGDGHARARLQQRLQQRLCHVVYTHMYVHQYSLMGGSRLLNE